MTDIFLITGFLGSGKTTFLKNQLRNNSSPVGVLMNEFGRIGIDGALVEEKDMALVELNNGSIFCSCLKGNFIDGVVELINKELDTIYIESSGLADPANMLNIIDILRQKSNKDFNYCGAVCILDALYFFKEFEMMTSVKNQVMHSNLIILNKTDLVDDETIDRILKTIYEVRGKVTIIQTSHGNVILSKCVIDTESIGAEATTNTENNRPRTFNLRIVDPMISIDEVKEIVKAMVPYCHRIKGIVRLSKTTYKVDSVQDTIDIVKDSKEYDMDNIVLISKIGIKLLSRLNEDVSEELVKKIDISL